MESEHVMMNQASLQAYYLAAPFAIERAPTVSVRGLRRTAAGGVTIVQLSDYPVRHGSVSEFSIVRAVMASTQSRVSMLSSHCSPARSMWPAPRDGNRSSIQGQITPAGRLTLDSRL